MRARELVLDALEGRKIEIEEENDDIFVLSRALYNAQCIMHNAQLLDRSDQLDLSDGSQLSTFNLHASGTALRFMTAYCAAVDGEWVLSGTERLCERPIKPLVDVLRAMGAKIEYLEKEGFAPLKIEGRRLKGGRVRLDASESSQFASALMLIADKVDGGIEIDYEGDVASQSYISLTQKVIEKYRSGVRCSGERDWSSATVWYAAMAVMKEGRFLLDGLSLNSCQPDRKIVEVFEKLGVRTMVVANGVVIESNGCVVDKLVLDCKNMPDAVVYIAVAACLLGVEFEISGVETLRVKESDRIEALMTEIRKCGYVLKYDEIGKICWCGERCEGEKVAYINTYNDHRMAMSMAVIGLMREIEIENPKVVNKSYPAFWAEFNKMRNEELL
ncbi:MAG: 3-phosphoshikimate 1-carboxyvinyltransferase [Paludibacteraceae bacterium]|nr:3-phosphoshikimate 1-carboxyvinyltransferase [Paludibacteraceae bacterium]